LDLQSELLREHSKAQCEKIAGWAGDSSSRFDQLLRLVMSGKDILLQRGCWPLSTCMVKHPDLVQDHYEAILKKLLEPGIHNAYKRNILGALIEIDIPEKFHGDILNTCFDMLNDPQEFVAVKANAISVLGKMAKLYPDIRSELRTAIEMQIPGSTPAFKARAKQYLKRI